MGGINSSYNERSQRIRKTLILFSISLIMISIILHFLLNGNNFKVFAQVYSSSITMEQSTHKVIKSENMDVKLPMASTTKVLTAYIACDSKKLDDVVTIPKEAVGIEGSSIYLRVGEKITLRDLVYGLMLRSGNDSAVAIACYLGGSIEGFNKIMNEYAVRCGAINSNFLNPHGLHDDDHYTTAYDLALITAKAMDNEEFTKIVSTKNYIAKSEGQEPRYFTNKNKMLQMYEGAIGVKTGYTKKAGRCLVSSAKKNGITIISVVLNKPDMWNDSIENLNTGFRKCKLIDIVAPNKIFANIKLSNSETIMQVYASKKVSYPMMQFEEENLSFNIKLSDKLSLPLKKGDKVGVLEIFDKKHLIFTENIYTISDIEGKGECHLREIASKWTNW